MRGIVCGAFDLLHPGYVEMFSICKKHCDELIVALHVDPSIARGWKNAPIIPLHFRHMALEQNNQVDRIIPYQTEEDCVDLLRSVDPDVRFLGDDYRQGYTGSELGIRIVWIPRSHGWSMTKVRNELGRAEQVQGATKQV